MDLDATLVLESYSRRLQEANHMIALLEAQVKTLQHKLDHALEDKVGNKEAKVVDPPKA